MIWKPYPQNLGQQHFQTHHGMLIQIVTNLVIQHGKQLKPKPLTNKENDTRERYLPNMRARLKEE